MIKERCLTHAKCFKIKIIVLGEIWHCPPWPETTITIGMSYFTTRDLGKEHGINKPPLTRWIWEGSKGDTTCPTISQNLSHWHPSWLSNACSTREEGPWIRKIGQRQPGNWSHRHKTSDFKKEGRAVLLGSVNLLLSGRRPFPIKSLALSACVSPQIIHFWVLDKSPLLGPGRGPLSFNKGICFPWNAPS